MTNEQAAYERVMLFHTDRDDHFSLSLRAITVMRSLSDPDMYQELLLVWLLKASRGVDDPEQWVDLNKNKNAAEMFRIKDWTPHVKALRKDGMIICQTEPEGYIPLMKIDWIVLDQKLSWDEQYPKDNRLTVG